MGILNNITGRDLLTGGTSLLGSAIGAGVGLIQAGQERKFNAEQAQINREFQTSEREAAQAWNLEQWNRENEYNSPAAQMQRMIEAGINPNTAAGAIGGNAGSPGQVRTSGQSGATASTPSVAGNLMDTIGGSVNTMWQNINQQREVEGKDIDNEYKGRLYGVQLRQAETSITKMLAETAKTEQDKKNAEETGKWISKRSEAEIKTMNQTLINLQQQWKQMEANIKKTEAETGVVEKQKEILTEQQKIEAIKAEFAQQGIVAGYNDLQSLLIYMQRNDISDLFDTILNYFNPDDESPATPEDVLAKYTLPDAGTPKPGIGTKIVDGVKESLGLNNEGADRDAMKAIDRITTVQEIDKLLIREYNKLENASKFEKMHITETINALQRRKARIMKRLTRTGYTPYGEGDAQPF